MFMQVEQGTKHPEASRWHSFSQMFTVVIGCSRNYQIRVIKLSRGSNILNINKPVLNLYFQFQFSIHKLDKSLCTSFVIRIKSILMTDIHKNVIRY